MYPLKNPKISNKYIFYDIECLQEAGNHTPIYIFAMCLEKGDTWVFKGTKCVSDFVSKFIKPKYRGYTFIAHYAMRYDSYFIVRQLLTERQKIKLIAQASKLICVTVIKLGIRFIDSSNFLPMKLAQLPQAMGFEGSKSFFPHIFNTTENLNYVGPMPTMENYGIDSMMPLEKATFLSWYRDNENNTFDLQKELASYCQQNVKILRKACTLYREEIMAMTVTEEAANTNSNKQHKSGIDPFQLVTLAGVSMAMYKYMFLQPNTIAILPHDNYHRQTKRYSTPAIQWLMYLEHTEGIEIKHALKGGEEKVGRYFLDGYAEVEGCRTAFEFNGCFFHGCSICYEQNARNPITGTTYCELKKNMEKKHSYLSTKGFVVRNIWEHEWKEMLESDKNLRAFLSKNKLPIPLQPRDAFFGGRTNAVSLYYKAKHGEEIHYYDFTSLYPFVNKTKEYPIGHPSIIYKDFRPLSEYFGIAKVKVLPPRGLFFPVLPTKMGGKLIFTLCRTCAETKQWEPCAHRDEERALEGTWCTVELLKAIEKSYRIISISEIWHFEQRSKDLFSEYVNKNLRQKQEASGYPSWCTDAEKKNKYINTFYEKEGIQLRPDQIVKNPTKRQSAKLLLNSLWGKFGQRTDMSNTSIVREPSEVLNYAFSTKYEVISFDVINDDAVIISWKYAKDHYTQSGDTNAIIACFTTAYARLELYDVLDRLQDRCLYYDTDSVIFVSRQEDWKPPLGDFLGDLTSEIPANQYITEFVSSGPKSYGYKLSDGQVCMKVKGITLNVSNSEKINFDTFKDLVLDYCPYNDHQNPKNILVKQDRIVSTKGTLLIQIKSFQRTLRVTYDKRVLCKDFKSLPYGY
ncbi:uncharacterized protein LOC121931305 [Sceloporus undulatus]|uniref:uncharacterized protein LOC121931305 n=1 Tax=Sceloporus undulatus TaxID=8520 RepID=UPI001C4A9743|nr:uncharacterized protein LOC121931305 [Sceloporus undulatus]XP_042324843.1 uncharacterized protein LOC121931305 [Sceloporus undulatus]XP_042324844.1 uncharacterized protein LOC121931305 [Sceloporus undulatus]XP_042324845.1 uncharacterized protein LOC121931305 [Sceloporus undulatus]XP_042324846.1 uncharacterized protein LOC121931305 [Sceloporus undulatus]XP_042324848.1 uncharacterized protein LOC121931305 [Sceloporus undulatus]XP_042324849.1 uncharacterized protein LOC121931305 [Sceloporus u